MKSKIYTCICVIIYLALTVFGGVLFTLYVMPSRVEDAATAACVIGYILLAVVGLLCADVLHECAHFLVGLCCSMGVKMPKIKLFSSSSVSINPRGAKHIKGRMIATTCAGLAVNLIVIAFCIADIVLHGYDCLIFAWLAAPSVYIFLLNVAPFEYNGGSTDGLVLWQLISRQPSSLVMLAILKVQGQVNCGTLLKDIDESWLFDVPQLPEDDINFIILTRLRYEYFIAKDDDKRALEYYNRFNQLVQYLPEEYLKDIKKDN